ncbi:methyltransferase [Pontibacter sp. E15-1]|uniref:tRNA1(Val) (adenine(37)-N6)-methyltransferase n=1 Tax=Pontibacter sp. E15-1 TaxID=2919918 RepID=UPI001F4FED1F|nr:methyltransferase [Pontibacter sp. E15-1]MCJ8166525.1 methyltransferase [Pontibacter sp. E15-1]
MANTYFQFKQFRVEQDRCAMKVCTDSCVFGAYLNVAGAKRVLDIGAGTGLLSLQVAQRTEATIDAVEIHPEAQLQATENFAASPWADRLTLHPLSLQQYAAQHHLPYDVILSNPPFFLASLKSDSAAKNTAKHTGDLFFEDILQFAQAHLSSNGCLYLLLPPAEALYFEKSAAEHKLYLSETIAVYTYVGGKCIRHIQTFGRVPIEAPVTKQFYIRQQDKTTYTPEFVALLQPYYLHL